MAQTDGKKSSTGVSLAVIATIVVACIGAIGTITVAYIQFIVQPSISLKATQTAEVLRLTQTKLAETAAGMETNPLNQNTFTVTPVTATTIPSLTPSPSETPIPTPTYQLISRRFLIWSGGFIPDLVTAWEISDDGTQITYTLEQNVLMADGSPFDANVAREKMVEKLGAGTDIDIIDDHTIRLNLGLPSASVTSDIMELISTIDIIVRK